MAWEEGALDCTVDDVQVGDLILVKVPNWRAPVEDPSRTGVNCSIWGKVVSRQQKKARRIYLRVLIGSEEPFIYTGRWTPGSSVTIVPASAIEKGEE